jgi:hypothetical protein
VLATEVLEAGDLLDVIHTKQDSLHLYLSTYPLKILMWVKGLMFYTQVSVQALQSQGLNYIGGCVLPPMIAMCSDLESVEGQLGFWQQLEGQRARMGMYSSSSFGRQHLQGQGVYRAPTLAPFGTVQPHTADNPHKCRHQMEFCLDLHERGMDEVPSQETNGWLLQRDSEGLGFPM